MGSTSGFPSCTLLWWAVCSSQLGWAITSAHNMKYLKIIHQGSVYQCPTVTQVNTDNFKIISLLKLRPKSHKKGGNLAGQSQIYLMLLSNKTIMSNFAPRKHLFSCLSKQSGHNFQFNIIHVIETYLISTLLLFSSTPRLQQEAVARGLEREYELFGTPESYFQQLPAMLHRKRQKLASCLGSVGLQPVMPEGGYFMIADISSVSEWRRTNTGFK